MSDSANAAADGTTQTPATAEAAKNPAPAAPSNPRSDHRLTRILAWPISAFLSVVVITGTAVTMVRETITAWTSTEFQRTERANAEARIAEAKANLETARVDKIRAEKELEVVKMLPQLLGKDGSSLGKNSPFGLFGDDLSENAFQPPPPASIAPRDLIVPNQGDGILDHLRKLDLNGSKAPESQSLLPHPQQQQQYAGLLLWARFILVTNHPRTAIAMHETLAYRRERA